MQSGEVEVARRAQRSLSNWYAYLELQQYIAGNDQFVLTIDGNRKGQLLHQVCPIAFPPILGLPNCPSLGLPESGSELGMCLTPNSMLTE